MIRYLIADPIGGFIRLLYMFPALVLGFTVHEFAHSFAALKMGDTSQKESGRLTLNPLKHIDTAGLVFFLLFGFGWAKPVEINRFLYDDRKKGDIVVSLAGIAGNLILCILGALLYSVIPRFGAFGIVSNLMYQVMNVNSNLFALNLLPIPPLDGSKIIKAIAPAKDDIWVQLERYGFIILFVLSVSGILGRVLGVISSALIYFSMFVWSFL